MWFCAVVYLHYNQLIESVADARFPVSQAGMISDYICRYFQSRPGAVQCSSGGLGKGGVRGPKGLNHRPHAAYSLEDVGRLDGHLAQQIRQLAWAYGLDADQ
ncbi:hypothetical protein EON64_19770 [archaeon]|nr:MAG: hypothetical protein EON64_19770 [archaeon]